MAKKSRATFQKREKEKARQQKQHDKAQRRLETKARRSAGELPVEADESEYDSLHPEVHTPAR